MPPGWAGSISTTWQWTRPAPKGGYDLAQLRALQDWFIRYQLNAVPGVAEVGSIGGFVRQYQIEVSSLKLHAYGRSSLQEVLEAVEQSNLNVGGKVIEESGMEFVVRGLGLVRIIADLENIVLKAAAARPSICAMWPPSSSAAISAAARWMWTARKWSAASWSCATARTAWPSSRTSRRRSRRSAPEPAARASASGRLLRPQHADRARPSPR